MSFVALLRRVNWDPGAGRKGRPRFRPRPEVLEDRLAPANLIVNTSADETGSANSLSLRQAINIVPNTQSLNGLSDAQRFAPESLCGALWALAIRFGSTPASMARRSL